MSCRNNFVTALMEVLTTRMPDIDKKGIFKVWRPLARCKSTWESLIDEHFKSLQPKPTTKIMKSKNAQNYDDPSETLKKPFYQERSKSKVKKITNSAPKESTPLYNQDLRCNNSN